jgi:hypothetical protein
VSKGGQWQSRIVGSGEEAPDQLLANPANWRIHPRHQQEALMGVLAEVGWVQQVIVNRTTGHLVDGHLRVQVALQQDAPMVPVLYVELTPAEEALILATLDPLAALAATDAHKLEALLHDTSTGDQHLQQMLATLAEGAGLVPPDGMGTGEADDYTGADAGTGTSGAGGVSVEGDPHAAGSGEARSTLAERFVVPPFTVLDARQGYWQERKRAWVALGIHAELGRSQTLIGAGRDGYGGDYDTTKGENAWGGAGGSLFDPVLCEVAYRWFTPPGGRILDPFAGECTKGIVAAYLGYQYTGIEVRPEQVDANRANAAELGLQPEWLVGDSGNLAAVLPEGQQYDLMFTSPPYYDLEVYSADEGDISNRQTYAEFLAWYRHILHSAAGRLADDRFAVLKVGDVRDKRGHYRNFVSDTIGIMLEAGLHLYNEAILVTPVGSLPIRVARHFPIQRKLGKGHQNVLVFVKGDARAATDACGVVEVAFPEGMPAEREDGTDDD